MSQPSVAGFPTKTGSGRAIVLLAARHLVGTDNRERAEWIGRQDDSEVRQAVQRAVKSLCATSSRLHLQ